MKIISLNIQSDIHHHLALPFLKNEDKDVVCIQEIFEDDLEMYEKELGMKSFFKPMCYLESFVKGDGKEHILGLAIFTNHEAVYDFEYIIGKEDEIPYFEKPENSLIERNKINILVMWTDIKIGNESYKISTSHFTWTPEGISTEYQKEDARKLIKILDTKLREFVLTGDLNAPRGNETFSMLAERYTDNIPLSYDTSLDPELHRTKGSVKRMVDGLFSTKEYKVTNTELREGVSDHKAIIANIEKI
jgi:exonuclease III